MSGNGAEHRTICIFSAFFYPYLGGIEGWTDSLMQALAAKGYRVILVVNNHANLSAYEEYLPGIEIYRLPCRVFANNRYPVPKKDDEFKRLWGELLNRDMWGLLINTRFYEHSLMGCDMARAHGLRPIVVDHGSSWLGFGNPRIDWAVRAYERGFTQLVKAKHPDFYGVSHASSRWLEHFGISPKGVLHNSIDAEAYRASASGRDFRVELGLPEDAYVVAWTGRLVPQKGTNCLLGMAPILAEKSPRTHVLVAGDGPERGHMESYAYSNLHLLGRLSHEDVSQLLSTAQLFCFPSLYPEATPSSIMEAAAWALPAVCSDTGGVKELIPDGQACGTVLPSQDSDPFVERILWYQNNPAIAREHGANLRRRIETEYTWPDTARRVIDALEHCRTEEAGMMP